MGTEINWFEIHVLDLDRAEAFYKKIFNASFFEMKDYPYDARGITLNETPESLEGALVKHPSRRPSHEHGTILFLKSMMLMRRSSMLKRRTFRFGENLFR